jgi:FkbH-like protein
MTQEISRSELRDHLRDASSAGDVVRVLRYARDLMRASEQLGDAVVCHKTLMKFEQTLEAEHSAKRLRTYIVRSTTIEPIMPALKAEAILSGYMLEIAVGGFGSFADDLLNPHGSLFAYSPDLVFLLLELEDICGPIEEMCACGSQDGVEVEVHKALARMRQLIEGFRALSTARLVIQGFTVPDRTSLGDVGEANWPYSLTNAVRRLNVGIALLCNSTENCVFFDSDQIAGRFGRAQWRDRRMFLSSRVPIAPEAFTRYSRALVRSFASMIRAPRKVLCTDLDNTLWGGILGEDGVNGIATGSSFPGNCYWEYQRYLKQLSSRGVLLVILSKNSAPDVSEAFSVRARDLAVSLDDFSITKINWEDKIIGIQNAAAELNLDLSSFVFVDDNPVECEAMRRALPEIAVIEMPAAEPWRFVDILSSESLFDVSVISAEDKSRVMEYKAQGQRRVLEQNHGRRDEFLASLNMVCTFSSAIDAPLSRAVQLLAKTNQFNLTTRRHSGIEVERFASIGHAVAIRVADQFGDAGVVGLSLIRDERERAFIDTFLLSCRVIGRGVETALLSHVAQKAKARGIRWLVGEWIPTEKNGPSTDFYPNHGFVPMVALPAADSLSRFFELDLQNDIPNSPSWMTVQGDS